MLGKSILIELLAPKRGNVIVAKLVILLSVKFAKLVTFPLEVTDTPGVDVMVIGVQVGLTVMVAIGLLVLLPLIVTLVAGVLTGLVNVIEQLFPAPRAPVQPLANTAILLPTGMLAVMPVALTGEAILLVTVSVPLSPASNVNELGLTLIVAIGAEVTVTATFSVVVLSPSTTIFVGPSIAGLVKVMLHVSPIARLGEHVLLCCVMLLPPGMVDLTIFAATVEPRLLVTLMVPVPPAVNISEVGLTLKRAVGAAVTVASTATVLVLLPLISTDVGPSIAALVNVIVQLVPTARLLLQLLLRTVILLPEGITAATFVAGTVDVESLKTVNVPLEFWVNTRTVGLTLMVDIGTGVTVTSTWLVLVLLPLTPIIVGPSVVDAVKVIVQLAPIVRLAPQVLV